MGFRCEGVGQVYRSASGDVTALQDVSFEADDGEFLCIVGPSGCGKSTLLMLLSGLLAPTTGRVECDGELTGQRLQSAVVFQEHSLFPWMNVLDNVAFGLERQPLSRHERRAKARRYIEKVGLADFASKHPDELSGGMRQRAGIARALVSGAPLLLMDEPFGSLDAQTKLVLQDELLRTWRDDQKLIVYVTHDIEEALILGDRVLVMTGRPGRIREEIRVPFDRPREPVIRDDPQLREIKWHIWHLLEDEVRKSLSLLR